MYLIYKAIKCIISKNENEERRLVKYWTYYICSDTIILFLSKLITPDILFHHCVFLFPTAVFQLSKKHSETWLPFHKFYVLLENMLLITCFNSCTFRSIEQKYINMLYAMSIFLYRVPFHFYMLFFTNLELDFLFNIMKVCHLGMLGIEYRWLKQCLRAIETN